MPRPPVATSAFEAFPAQEFDAWVDKLRDTIITGLEPDVPEVHTPILSTTALEAIRSAKEEAARAEEAAALAARFAEEETRALQQELAARHAAAIESETTTLQSSSSAVSEAQRVRYTGTLEQLFDRQRRRDANQRLSSQERGAEAKEAQSLNGDEEIQTEYEDGREEDEEQEGAADVGIHAVHHDFESEEVLDHRFAANQDDIEEEFEDGVNDQTEYYDHPSISSIQQPEYDGAFVDGATDQMELSTRQYSQTGPIEVGLDTDDEDAPEDGSGDDSGEESDDGSEEESGEGSEEESEEGSELGSRDELEEGDEQTPRNTVGDYYVDREERTQLTTDETHRNGAAFDESDRESDAPAELEQEQELESQHDRMSARNLTQEPATEHIHVGEEEEDGQDELSQSSQDEELGAEEVTSAPPDGYARRVFSYHVNDQGTQEVFHRVQIFSEQEEGETSEAGTDDETDSGGAGRQQDDTEEDEHYNEEIDVSQSRQYGMALRQEFALSEASSPGGEENAIEVPDDSDEEQEHQLNQRDTRRESSGERDMAQERATNSDDESGEDSNANEESFGDGSDRSQSHEQYHQEPLDSRRAVGEYAEVDSPRSGREDDRSENEDTNSIIEDGNEVSEPIVSNDSPYPQDDGVDELAEVDTHEEATYFPGQNDHVQPRPANPWEASLIDPALQTGAVLQSVVRGITYTVASTGAVNHVSPSPSSVAIHETMQFPMSAQVTSVQPELPTLVIPSREEDMITDDEQTVDPRPFSAEDAEAREEDLNEITSITSHRSITPVDKSTHQEAGHGIIDVSEPTPYNRALTPLLSKATVEYEADDERSARRLPSTSPSKETSVNMDLPENVADSRSQRGTAQGGPGSPSSEDQDMDGITQEGEKDELEADADVSSNGDTNHLPAPSGFEAVDDTPQADPKLSAAVGTAVRSSAALKPDNVEVQHASFEEESLENRDTEGDAGNGSQARDSNNGFVEDLSAVSTGSFTTTKLPESRLSLDPEANKSLLVESSGMETGIVPAANVFNIHSRAHEIEDTMEDRKAIFNTASHGKDTTGSQSAGSDEERGYPSVQEILNTAQGPDQHLQEQREPTPVVTFDGTAEFVPIASPIEGGKDELEEGEIRSSDEDMGGEVIPRDSIINDLAIEGEVSFQGEEDTDDSSTSDDSQEEGGENLGAENSSSPQYPDGIRHDSAEAMGSQQESVRVDEVATMDEDDSDATPDPDYDADSRDSAENVQYDSEDPPPVPLGVEDDGIEVDPEDSDALRAEIRSHDLSDIPHKEEHLVEEDEEYNDDEPEHHIDGLPVGYEAYDVVDETNPDDIALFEVAERSHKGIEGERTTEQLTIQEMELRQQPGNAVRAKRDARDLADTTIVQDEDGNQEEIMPAAPSPEQVYDRPSGEAREGSLAMEGDIPPVVIEASSSEQKGHDESDVAQPPNDTESVQGTRLQMAADHHGASVDSRTPPTATSVMGDDDIFSVPSPAEPSHPTESRTSVIALLHDGELPKPPQHGRSPSPLAPESLLQHDAALAMEPTPLSHRHDHHHNVVLEESHRIHEAKRQSFVSAIASVHGDVPTPDDSGQTEDEIGHAEGDNNRETEQQHGEVAQSSSSSQAPSTRLEHSIQDAPTENEDDDEDPLRLNGPFDDPATITPSRVERTEVYVEVPAMERAKSISPEDRRSIVQQRPDGALSVPVTPMRPPMLGADPTRHHHGPVPSISFSSVRSEYSDISGSPAAHTRSQCHYHKIRFGRGVFSHVVLVPHCSIGTEASREQIGASDLGRVTKEEMGKKRDLNFGSTFTSRMTSDVEPLPENLEHQVRQLAGSDLLREGHIWLLPLEDVTPESALGRRDGDLNDNHFENAYHIRSSPRLQPSSQTPDRKRKRGSSHARSASSTRSDGDIAGSSSRRSHSPPRVRVPYEMSQIAENEKENRQGGSTEKADGGKATDNKEDIHLHQEPSDVEVNIVETRSGTGHGEGNDVQDMTSEQAISPKQVQRKHNEIEDDDVEELPNKKRVIELENGEGPSAVKVAPAPKKSGWLSWLLGRK